MMSEWQPIDTAPQRGVVLVLSAVTGVHMAKRAGTYWFIVTDTYGTEAFEWIGDTYDRVLIPAPVTHWMPLPPGPAEDGETT